MANLKKTLYLFIVAMTFIFNGCSENEPLNSEPPTDIYLHYEIKVLNNDGTLRDINEEDVEKMEIMYENWSDYEGWGFYSDSIKAEDNILKIKKHIVLWVSTQRERYNNITGMSFVLSLRSKAIFGTNELIRITDYFQDFDTTNAYSSDWAGAFRTKTMKADNVYIDDVSEELVGDILLRKQIVIRLKE